MRLLLPFLLFGLSFAAEIPLKVFIQQALKENLELKSYKNQVKATEYEYKAAKGLLFPTLKIEETFTKTDIPAYVLFTKLNQERITAQDFLPDKLNNPDSIENFETKLSIEIPIWIGGKLRAFKNMSKYKWFGEKTKYGRKEEEVILKVFEAYANAVLAKNAVKVAKMAVKDAEEHVRLAEKAYKTGVALFADVLRAKVYLSKAQEKLSQAENNYKVAKKALELLVNKSYGDFDVKDFEGCPIVDKAKLKKVALENREDYKAISYYLKFLKEGEKGALGDILPHFFAFANYSTYDKNIPFGTQGNGYMVGIGMKWQFNTGLSPLFKVKGLKRRELALRNQKELLAKAIMFEIDKAFADYENALKALESAEIRLKESEEVLRVVKKRYEVGMARVVDLLDAQTQLDNARFEYVKALRDCNIAYAKALFAAGVLKEEVRK
ncbi:MAG TPA: TolC family protein [Aquifex aeolicus]|nr:TolC family protein [Aquifex aeolicus]